MLDVSQRPYDVLQLGGGQNEGVSAGQQYVCYFGVVPQISQGGGQVSQIFLLGVYEDSLAETVTAYSFTHVADQHQDGGVVLMLETGDDRIGFFVGRIKPAPFLDLLCIGYYDSPYRVVRIVPVDEREIVVIAAKSEFVRDLPEPGSFLRAEMLQLVGPC